MTEKNPEDEWLSLTSTAVSSLASTIVSSTATGHTDWAPIYHLYQVKIGPSTLGTEPPTP